MGGREGSIRTFAAQRLFDRQAQFAPSLHGSVRCARYAGELSTARVEHPRPASLGVAEWRYGQSAGRLAGEAAGNGSRSRSAEASGLGISLNRRTRTELERDAAVCGIPQDAIPPGVCPGSSQPECFFVRELRPCPNIFVSLETAESS